MIVLAESFGGEVIRYSLINENGVLFNTSDVCRVLFISASHLNGVLGYPCLYIAGVIEAALADEKNCMALVDWVEAHFIGYDIHTPVSPNCDEQWELKLK